MTADPFTAHMEAVARHLLGEPNAHLSSTTELRFGKQGSMSVDIAKGTFFDHESEQGGGVLALIGRETGAQGVAAVDWLKTELGVVIESNYRAPKERVAATYDYVDEHGEVLLQVIRYEPKTFRQRRPDGDGWSWSVKGVRAVPYRLPELIEAISRDQTVFVVEGEKDVDALARIGVTATCNAGGAGKWPATFAEHFRGARVVILPDNDDAGRAHRDLVGASLAEVADVRVLELPGLPPKGDVSDWLKAGGGQVELLACADAVSVAWRKAPQESRFGAIQWADLDHVEMRQDYLVEDMLFCGDSALMYGASGCGKSFLALDMGLSIARGVPFLGKATRKGAVIYQAGEGGKGLVKRMKAYRQTYSVWKQDLPFILIPARVDLFSPDGDVDAFIDECLAWQAVLTEPLQAVFIDTFSTASPGANENASEDVSRLLAAGERLQKATGAALMWVHHKNASGERERGHTSLRANCDTALEINRDEESNYRTLRLAKLKDGEDGLKIGFELQSVQVGSNDDGKPITSCVVVPAQEGPEQTSKRTRLPPGQAKFLKVLEEAQARRGGIVPPNERVSDGTRGVEYCDFRDYYAAICGGGQDAGALRTALSRDGNSLFAAGLIDQHSPWLWITAKGERFL